MRPPRPRRARTALAALLVLAACAAPPAPLKAPPRPAGFDVEAALDHTRTLSTEIGPRPAGSAADRQAADYLAGRLAALGLRVERQPVPLPQGGTSWNVLGLPPGLRPEAAPHLLLGAHYDTVPTSPGAEDNAAGAGALLEIGRALGQMPAPLPVILVAFGAEEHQVPDGPHNLVGSRHFVANLAPAQRDRLAAMLCLDVVAHGAELQVVRTLNTPRGAADRLLAQAALLGIPAREVYAPFVSDQLPFLRAGIPAAWLWSGEYPQYHSPADTLERLEPAALERAGRLVLATLRSYR